MERYKRLNDTVIEIYDGIGLIQQMISDIHGINLTIVEIHILERIKNNPGISIKGLTELSNVTAATMTVQVQKLVRKGYCSKEKSQSDGRGIELKCTREGEKIVRLHEFFHVKLVRDMISNLSEEEIEALSRTLIKVDENLKKYIEATRP